MTIFGKPLTAYVRFAKVFIGLVLVVGLVRLAASLAGVPNSSTNWLSMTALGWIGVFDFAVRVHTTRFGSYKHLLPPVAIVNLTAQAIAIVAIVIAIFTGVDNIFSAPEYAFGSDGKTWIHLAAHLFIGTTVGTLIPWIVGSLVLFLSKKALHTGPNDAAARA